MHRERLQARKTAASYEALMRRILHNSGDRIELLDFDGHVLSINPAGLAMLAPQDDPAPQGALWLEGWPVETRPAAAAALSQARSGAVGRFRSAELDIVVMPAASAVGEAPRLLSMARITRRDAGAQADAGQWRQAQKMEAICQLTGGIANDFNSLLTGVMGSIEMMRNHLGGGRVAELTRYMDAAAGAASRAAALTQHLLAFSRRQTLDPRPVVVDSLIAGLVEPIRRLADRTTLQLRHAPGLWTVFCDPGQLKHALLNLVRNSLDAMPGDGQLVIETANLTNDRREPGQELPAGEFVAISVTDSGVGMSDEVATRAFDPYFTTKTTGHGAGLGLSMIHGFARQSGGDVRISSNPDGGARVTIWLPRYLLARQSEPGSSQG